MILRVTTWNNTTRGSCLSFMRVQKHLYSVRSDHLRGKTYPVWELQLIQVGWSCLRLGSQILRSLWNLLKKGRQFERLGDQRPTHGAVMSVGLLGGRGSEVITASLGAEQSKVNTTASTCWEGINKLNMRGCNHKFPDWPHGARTANCTALCHQVQLYHHSVSRCIKFCRHNPFCVLLL